MSLLTLGLALWWGSHLFPILAPNRRAAAVAKLGATPYRGVFALFSLSAMALMVIGYRNAPVVDLWYPPPWTVHVNNTLMLLAVALLGARDFKSGLRRWVRHPMLAAVIVWAVAHLMVNGDFASVLLFGVLLVWAVVAILGSNRRDGPWLRPGPGTVKGAVLHLVATVVVFAAIVYIHGELLGVWPLPA